MVPTRFAWPHGGRHVSLSGSFVGWNHHFPMTPIEGSATIFQTICNIPPGYHQYKFLVDGIWMHDEQQPCITNDSGSINNVIFVREPEIVSSILPSESPILRASMEVDNGIFHPMASSSGGHRDPPSQFADTEIEVSRIQISTFLSSYTAYDAFPNSGKYSVIDVTMPVKQAFHVMYAEASAVVPVWDSYREQCMGMLTASDFILILMELHNNGSKLTHEELERHSISAWKEGKSRLSKSSSGSLQHSQKPLIQAKPEDSLKDLALLIVRNEISVVPIIHYTQDGSCPQLLHLACLSGILRYICRYFQNSPAAASLLQCPIFSIPIGTWLPEMGRANLCNLSILRQHATLDSALNLLMEAQVSSIPIVDGNGFLLDVFARSDITSLAKGSAYANIQLDQIDMHQVLRLVYEANSAINGQRRCETCLRTDSLQSIMLRLSDPVVRRLIVVEARTNRVEGVISLSDIFKFLLG